MLLLILLLFSLSLSLSFSLSYFSLSLALKRPRNLFSTYISLYRSIYTIKPWSSYSSSSSSFFSSSFSEPKSLLHTRKKKKKIHIWSLQIDSFPFLYLTDFESRTKRRRRLRVRFITRERKNHHLLLIPSFYHSILSITLYYLFLYFFMTESLSIRFGFS